MARALAILYVLVKRKLLGLADTISSVKLIVGIGNVGGCYANTRHNTGFRVVQHLAPELKEKKAWYCAYEKIAIEGVPTLCITPTTMVNASGKAVSAVMRFFSIAPKDVLVVLDDKDLPFGSLRLKQKGGFGGHNGMKDIIAMLGTKDVSRLKIGVANASLARISTDSFVLGEFYKKEEELLPDIIKESTQCITKWVTGNITAGTFSVPLKP